MHYIEKAGMMVVKINSKFDLRRLCNAVGATPLVRLGKVSKYFHPFFSGSSELVSASAGRDGSLQCGADDRVRLDAGHSVRTVEDWNRRQLQAGYSHFARFYAVR